MQFTPDTINSPVEPQYLPEPKIQGFNIPNPSVGSGNESTVPTTATPAQAMDSFFSKPDQASQDNPISFNWDESNADRFVDSKYYKSVGYDPRYQNDFETRYDNIQSFGDKVGKALTGLGEGAYQGFKNQLESWKDTASLFSHPDLQYVFQKDELQNIADKAKAFDDQNHIFTSTSDQTSFFSWNNFLKQVQGVGPLVGSVLEMGAETIAVDFATGGLGAVAEADRAATLLGQVAKGTERLGAAIDPVSNLRNSYESFKESKSFSDMADLAKTTAGYVGDKAAKTLSDISSYLPLSNTAKFAGEGLSGAYRAQSTMRTVAQGFGSFYRDMRDLNLAIGMSQGNASSVYTGMVQDNVANFKKDHGRPPTDVELSGMQDNALQAAKKDGALNAFATLYLNKLAFSNILKGISPIEETLAEKGFQNEIGINSEKIYKETGEKLKLKDQGWNSFKNNLLSFKPVNYLEHGASFGVTMSAMKTVDETTKAYYDAKYNHKNLSWTDAVKDSIDKQFTKEGLQTFMSGFLTGAIGTGLIGSKVRDIANNKDYFTNREGYKERTNNTENRQTASEFVDQFNDMYKNPLKDNIANVVQQADFESKIKENVASQDRKGAEDIKSDASKQFIISAARSKMLDVYLDRLKDYTSNLSPEELVKAFHPDKEFTPELHADVLQRVNDFIGNAKDIGKTYKEVSKAFPNPFNPYKFEANSPEREAEALKYNLHKTAIDVATFAKSSVMDITERLNKIINGDNVSGGIRSVLKNTPYSTVTNLGDPVALKKELEILNLEKTALGPSNIREQNRIASQIDKYTEYQKTLNSYTNEYKSALAETDHEKKQELIKQIDEKYADDLGNKRVEIVNNQLKEDNKPLLTSDEKESMNSKFMDYHKLNAEYDPLLNFTNFILDPTNKDRFIDSVAKAQKDNIREQTAAQEEAKEAEKTQEQKDKEADFNQRAKDAEPIPFEEIYNDVPAKPTATPEEVEDKQPAPQTFEQNKTAAEVNPLQSTTPGVTFEVLPETTEKKPILQKNGLSSTTGRHFTDTGLPYQNENAANTYHAFSELKLNPNGLNFITAATQDNDKYGLIDPKYPDAVRVFLSDQEGNPIDKDGQIIHNPTKDNMLHLSLRKAELRNGNLLVPTTEEMSKALESVKKSFNTKNFTDKELEDEILEYRNLIHNITEGSKNGDYTLRITGKRQGVPVKSGIKGAKLSNIDRTIAKNTNWRQITHPNGMKMELKVERNGRVSFTREDGEKFPIFNRHLLPHEEENIVNALKFLASNPNQDDKTKISEYLHATTFYGIPNKDEKGIYINPGPNRIWIDNNRIWKSYLAKNAAGESIVVTTDKPFTVNSLETNKALLLANQYHDVNNSLLGKPYTQYSFSPTEGGFESKKVKDWDNYEHYLLADNSERDQHLKSQGINPEEVKDIYGLPNNQPPLHTNVAVWNSSEPQLKQVDLNFEDINPGRNILAKKVDITNKSSIFVADPTKIQKIEEILNIVKVLEPELGRDFNIMLEQMGHLSMQFKDGSYIVKSKSGLYKVNINKDGNFQVEPPKIEDKEVVAKTVSTITQVEPTIPADIKDVPIKQISNKPEPVSDIDVKRGDIEKRRQNELLLAKKDIYNNINDKNSIREVERNIKSIREAIGAMLHFLESNDYAPEGFKDSPSEIAQLKKDIAKKEEELEKHENRLIKGKEELINQINTKYDAELKALEQESTNEIKDVLDDIFGEILNAEKPDKKIDLSKGKGCE